jgi:hypothetical protein
MSLRGPAAPYRRCCRASLLCAFKSTSLSLLDGPDLLSAYPRQSFVRFVEAPHLHVPASAEQRTAMAVLRQKQSRESARARRAANNNYQRLIKTLVEKLEKLHRVYDTKVYLIAERNGRVRECVSTDRTGRPWLRPDQKALVSRLPAVSND